MPKNRKSKQYIESESHFSFSFGGENEIDAETFSTSIDSVVRSIRYITGINEPDSYAKMKIKSFGKGSFEVALSVIIESLPNILTEGTLLAGTIIEIYLGILEIKKHLKGKKPKSITYHNEQAEIINHEDKSINKSENIAKTYFEGNYIDNLTVYMFKALDNDSGRSDLIIKENEKERLKIGKEDYDNMSKEIVEARSNEKIMQQTFDTALPLKKPDLLGNSKWEFIFNKVIEVEMRDEDFKEKVQNGKVKLYAGIKIPVKLLLEQDLDDDGIPIKDTDRYAVVKVTGDIIEPPTQGKLG